VNYVYYRLKSSIHAEKANLLTTGRSACRFKHRKPVRARIRLFSLFDILAANRFRMIVGCDSNFIPHHHQVPQTEIFCHYAPTVALLARFNSDVLAGENGYEDCSGQIFIILSIRNFAGQLMRPELYLG